MKMADASILVVDDEPILCEIFAYWTRAVGCKTVYTAPDGEKALVLLQEHHIDLLVTDVRMPKMDGVTLVRRMGALSMAPSIIFVSGFGDVDQREMYELGVEAFLMKPSRREELLEVMEKALAERSSLWLNPMTAAPRQSMQVRAETREKEAFRLGRGGFSAWYGGRLSLGKVGFACLFADEKRELAGEGFVRWFSKKDERVGIEFAYLAPSCRSWVLEEMTEALPQCFIPNG